MLAAIRKAGDSCRDANDQFQDANDQFQRASPYHERSFFPSARVDEGGRATAVTAAG